MTSLKELRALVAQKEEIVHATTVAWVLHQSELYGRGAKRKPLLLREVLPGICPKAGGRLQGELEEGSSVRWEKKKKKYLAIRLDAMFRKHAIATMKHGGGNAMLWACLSAAAPGRLLKVERNMNAENISQNPGG